MRRKSAVICLWLALTIAFQPLIIGLANPLATPKTLAASDSGLPADGGWWPDRNIDTIEELAPLLETEKSNASISPQDLKNLNDYRVDVRITDYLLDLVTPKELGGKGLDYVKVNRLLKNYDTEGVGRFDREGATAANEEAPSYISTHNRGQAVDISEVGAITCKLVLKSHLGGNKTRWRSPRPVKVAWQTRDGLKNNPTPKGPSLMEISQMMGSDAIMQMLNESGELDAYADFVKGLDLGTILTYVGSNMLLKNLGATKITGDPMADSLINSLGTVMLIKNLPGLPDGFAFGNNDEDVRIALAKSKIEASLNLPPGSLRGYGWNEILQSAGKRTLENALGLPGLTLERRNLQDVLGDEAVKAGLNYLKLSDRAFDVTPETINKLKAGDAQALKMAGVNLIANALKLSSDQRSILAQAAKDNRHPNLDPATFPVEKEIAITDLENLLSGTNESSKKVQESLKKLGLELVNQALKKAKISPNEGVTREILNQLSNERKTVKLGELKEEIGSTRLAVEAGIEAKDAKKIKTNRGDLLSKIAAYFNKEYGLSGGGAVSSQDIQRVFLPNEYGLNQKIGGSQADKALKWSVNTGLQVIRGEKKLDAAAREIFTEALGSVFGLNRGRAPSLDGDLNTKYGGVIIEERLGMDGGLLGRKNSASDFSQKELEDYFYVKGDRSLEELRQDESYWSNDDNQFKWKLADARLGAPSGTTVDYLRGRFKTDQYSRTTGEGNFETLVIDRFWDYFDLGDDSFKLNANEANVLINNLKNWDSGNQRQTLELAAKLVSRGFDAQTGFAVDSFLKIMQNPNQETIANQLIDQGIRLLVGSIGVNRPESKGGFNEAVLNDVTNKLRALFNGTPLPSDHVKNLVDFLRDATGIPDQYRSEDILAFVRGDFRQALNAWSAATWEQFINKYLLNGTGIDYAYIRQTFFSDEADPVRRKELMEGARNRTQYKISDAFLAQAGLNVPTDFSEVMFTGTDRQRAELALSVVFAELDKDFKVLNVLYQIGDWQRIFKGDLEDSPVIVDLINNSDISFGPFSRQFVSGFYQYVTSSNRGDFFTDNRYSGMWSELDSWLGGELGIDNLPGGLGKSIYYASQNNWNFNASLTQNNQVVVQSLSSYGQDYFYNNVSAWGDKQFGLPAGTTYRTYQATTKYINASKAYASASQADKAAAGAKLNASQAELTYVAITIALNACKACQQFFSSIDSAIAAPPGFTNAAVAGAIAMSLGLGPAGLVIAVAIYFFGVYRVEYLCPVPPPDIYALTSFDPSYDAIDYKWGDYYRDPSHPERLEEVKSTPKDGQSVWKWADGVPFANGKDPLLWMAWSRYFTGKLLDSTLAYGEERLRPDKPKEIITYRQANVELFAPRVREAFGEIEKNNPTIGMGYSQKSTKLTDWVHVAFGGYF